MNTERKQKIEVLLKDSPPGCKSRQRGIENLCKARDGSAFVVLSPSDTRGGRLIDISMGGLMFEYLAMKAPSIEATELEILGPNGGFRLGGVPCKVIRDTAIPQVCTTSLHKRRCGVQFGELTESQTAQLEYFIHNYTTDET